MFCKACGNEVLATCVVCPKCGSATGGVAVPNPSDEKYIKWGWVCAILFPIGGFFFGGYNIVKGQVKHGVLQIIASIFMWSFWVGFIGAIQ
jgi:hypothetical protein